MELDVCQLKYDQIIENIVSFEKEEITFDISTSEIIKKGTAYCYLKIRNLLQTRIALRISIPKDRFKVSPIFSYLDSQETFTYKFTYIYKEKSNENNKIYSLFEVIQTPKIKKKENINPMTLFELIVKNSIPVKGFEKRIPIKIINSINYTNESHQNNPFLTSEKHISSRSSCKNTNTAVKKDVIEDINDPKFLCELLKHNIIYASNGNRQLKEEVENKIFNFFSKTSFFSTFLRFFRIDDNSLKQAIKYVEYLKVPKNYYLFIQGEKSKYFFGIVTGRVALRIRKKYNLALEPIYQQQIKNKASLKSKKTYLSKSNPNLKRNHLSFIPYDHNNDIEYAEVDYLKLGKGSCFGEWDLIYNLRRSTSALTIEDSELFILSKEHFHESLGNSIYKAENERKNFLVKCFPVLKDLHRTKIDEIYRKATIEVVSKNHIIYHENSKAEHLYIIIEGECRLEKNLTHRFEKEDSLNCKRILLLRLGIGDFSGLEHSSNIETYGTSLVSSCDATAVMSINLNNWPDLKCQIVKFLKPFHEQRTKYIKEAFNEYLSKKLRIKYHYKIAPNIKNENIIKRDEKEKLKKIENLIENVERKVGFSSPIKKHNIVSAKSYATSSFISPHLSQDTLQHITIKTNPNVIDVKRLNTCKDKKNTLVDNQLIKDKLRNETDNIKPVNESYIDEKSFKLAKNCKSAKLTRRVKKRYCISSIKDTSELEGNQFGKKKSESNFTFSFSQKIKYEKLKILSPKVKNSLIEWNQAITSNKFHSGNFNLPLYTLTKNE